MSAERNRRTTPIGLARFAKDYIDAAIVVDHAMGKGSEFAHASTMPAYFLLTHGLELTLKAFLRHKGLKVEQFRAHDLGHDLKALYAKACELGINEMYQLTTADEKAFDLLVTINVSQQLRYIQTGLKEFPSWEIAAPFVVRIHQAVSPKVGFRSLTQSYPAAASEDN